MKFDILTEMIPGTPVPYTMEITLEGEKHKYALTFQRGCRMHDRYGGMDGYMYTFQDRTYRDVDSLCKEVVETISDNVCIGIDAYGEKVLRIYTSRPTFDSSDREWDSRIVEYLMFDGRDIHLVVMWGGYRIAKLIFYKKLLSADIRMKPIFEKLGWPISEICWIP